MEDLEKLEYVTPTVTYSFDAADLLERVSAAESAFLSADDAADAEQRRPRVEAIVRAPGLDMRVAGEELIVHDRHNGRVHVLNRTAAEILRRCAFSTTPSALATRVCERYHVSHEVALRDVVRLVATLRTLGLVRQAVD